MLADLVFANLLDSTGCSTSTRRIGRVVIVSTGPSETPLPENCVLLDVRQTQPQSLETSLKVGLDVGSPSTPGEAALLRASIRQDLTSVIAEIRAMQDPDVPDEYRLLAEDVCSTSPGDETPQALRAWAADLGVGIASE